MVGLLGPDYVLEPDELYPGVNGNTPFTFRQDHHGVKVHLGDVAHLRDHLGEPLEPLAHGLDIGHGLATGTFQKG